jgi:hypothetical protein
MLLSDESASRARREVALVSLLAGDAAMVEVVVLIVDDREGDGGLTGSTEGSDGEEVPIASAALSLVVDAGIWGSIMAGRDSLSSGSALILNAGLLLDSAS